MLYRVANWDKLYPRHLNMEEEVWNPAKAKIVGELVGYFLSKPHTNPVDRFGNEPRLLQNFQNYPGNADLVKSRAELQNFIQVQNLAPTSFNQFWSNWQAKFVSGKDVYDTGYELIFQDVNLEGNDFWEVQTVSTSVTFREIQYGGQVYYYSHSDAKYTVYIKWYGAGALLDMRTLMARKFAAAEDLLMTLRNQAYVKKAQIYYALIEAVNVSQNVAWQAPIPAGLPVTDRFYVANRDARTINVAIESIIENCKTKGYSGDLTKETYIVLYDYRDNQRMKMANQVTMENNQGPKILDYNVIYLPTQMLTSQLYYYVILPKRKIQKGDILSLTQFQQFNQTTYTREVADWMGFGGNIGDIQQVQRCLKA